MYIKWYASKKSSALSIEEKNIMTGLLARSKKTLATTLSQVPAPQAGKHASMAGTMHVSMYIKNQNNEILESRKRPAFAAPWKPVSNQPTYIETLYPICFPSGRKRSDTKCYNIRMQVGKPNSTA
jgi:hypothetical protein